MEQVLADAAEMEAPGRVKGKKGGFQGAEVDGGALCFVLYYGSRV